MLIVADIPQDLSSNLNTESPFQKYENHQTRGSAIGLLDYLNKAEEICPECLLNAGLYSEDTRETDTVQPCCMKMNIGGKTYILDDDFKENAFQILDSIKKLEDNWNGNGAPKFADSTIHHTAEVISTIDMRNAEIYPTGRESIQIEWHNTSDTVYLEFEIYPDGNIEVFFENDDIEIESNFSLSMSNSVVILRNYIDEFFKAA